MLVNEAVLERGSDPEALFMFIHSQRTGGSNMQRWLRRVFGDEKTYSSRIRGDFVHWHHLTDASILENYRLFGGFSRFKEIDLKGRPLVGMSNVRHPFYRAISIYRMSRGHDGQFLHDVAIANSFEDFYRIASARAGHYFHNLSTWRIAGSLDWDRLLESLDRNFGLVATTNHLHEASRFLIQRFGWPVEPLPASGAPPDEENYARYADSPVRDQIIENNRADMRLFELVRAAAPPEIADAPRQVAEAPRAIADAPPSVRSQPAQAELFARHDSAFERARAAEPGLGHAEYHARKAARRLRRDELTGAGDADSSAETGERLVKKIGRLIPIAPETRVIDYGCGALRIGAPLIGRLEPGSYMGLDPVAERYEFGLARLDPALVAEKRPRCAVIGEAALAKAAAFDANLVVSDAGLKHIHPDEFADHVSNLARLAARPGAALVVDAMLADDPVRFRPTGWARPRAAIEQAFAAHGLALEGLTLSDPREIDGHQLAAATFAFRRKG